MEKIIGLGGLFLRAKDTKALSKWYDDHLGTNFGEHGYQSYMGANQNSDEPPGHTVFSFFKEDSKYFDPSTKQFMINFRVKNLDAMLAQLRTKGVQVMEKTETYDYGKFGWCVDPEGNKIELWEPIDTKSV